MIQVYGLTWNTGINLALNLTGVYNAAKMAGVGRATQPVRNAYYRVRAKYGGYGRIGSTGVIGEKALKALGGRSQVYFPTSTGGRYVDQLVNNVAHEAKVGYQSATKAMKRQIAKDVELIQADKIKASVWHFFRSPVTGRVGPSEPLRSALEDAGIEIVIHP